MTVEVWTSSGTQDHVGEFIEELPAKTQKKIIRDLELVEKYGTRFANMKKLKGNGLYEIKIRYNKIAYRIFCVIRDASCWLLHAFVKKSNSTPLREISTALYRSRELDNYLAFARVN